MEFAEKIKERIDTPIFRQLSEVAEEVGFFDRSRFCTAFKKHTGRTPLEYRQGKS